MLASSSRRARSSSDSFDSCYMKFDDIHQLSDYKKYIHVLYVHKIYTTLIAPEGADGRLKTLCAVKSFSLVLAVVVVVVVVVVADAPLSSNASSSANSLNNSSC